MRALPPATIVALAILLAGSGWLLWPASAGGADAGSAPIAPASATCDPCVSVVDDAPTHDHFENMLAVSPVDPMTVATASMYRDNGSLMQVGVWASHDGGSTWTRSVLPYGDNAPLTHPMRLVNGAVDPAITIASDGTILVSGVGFTNVGASSTQVPAQTTLFVARSTDGGLTFPIEDVTIIERSTAPLHDFADMPRFAPGPDGLVILAWGRATIPDPLKVGRFVATLDLNKFSSIEGTFSVSRDNGASWSEPSVAFQDDETTLYYPVHPAILADGSWIFMPSDYQNLDGGLVYLSRSTDEGATWSWESTGIVGLLQGAVAASHVDDRIYYSYLIPTGDLNWVIPAVAIADGPAGPWRTTQLTDEPVVRLSVEQTIAVDANGIAHVVYMTQSSGDPAALVRIATIAPDGSFTSLVMDELIVDHLATHYFGLDALPSGAVATWNAGEAPFALHAGAVRAS